MSPKVAKHRHASVGPNGNRLFLRAFDGLLQPSAFIKVVYALVAWCLAMVMFNGSYVLWSYHNTDMEVNSREVLEDLVESQESLGFSVAVSARYQRGALLCEWIEHYLLEGVEHFVLGVDLQAMDATAIATLQRYAHHIVTVDVGMGTLDHAHQTAYYAAVLSAVQQRGCTWLLVTEMDEFVAPRKYYDVTLAELVGAYDDVDISVVYIPWLIYGSNHHTTRPERCDGWVAQLCCFCISLYLSVSLSVSLSVRAWLSLCGSVSVSLRLSPCLVSLSVT
eukprot:m.235416 g.235416  ORF g.235416 m.235416 type:complete len:278 (-) comp19336_c0_seq10:1315-2148(-)